MAARLPEVAVLFFTAPTAADAARIGRALVEERLVACVNVIPVIRSIYRWEDKIANEGEALAIAKFRRDRAEAVIARVKALHGFELPEAIVLPVVAGNPDYLKWVAEG